MRAWLRRWIAGTPPASARTESPSAHDSRPLEPARAVERPALPDALLTGRTAADTAFVAWLLGLGACAPAAPGEREMQALRRLDRLLAATGEPGGHALLPRSAAVVPKLLALLRHENSTLAQLSQHVSRDLTLVAEVLRMANGAGGPREEPVVELTHAIRVLGAQGLRRAIARAVVKPLIEGGSSTGAAAAARRLWTHTDRKAQLCAAVAGAQRIDAFEAYLLALAHNAAWSSVLRVLDSVPGSAAWQVTPRFTAALRLRRDRLFACIAAAWSLGPESMAAAADVGRRGICADSAPAIGALCIADRLAGALCDPTDLGAADPWLHGLDPSVRACFNALADGEILAA